MLVSFKKKIYNHNIKFEKGIEKMIDKARELALKTLYKIDKEQAYSNVPGYPQAFEIMPKRINTP